MMVRCPKCGGEATGDPPVCTNEICSFCGKAIALEMSSQKVTEGVNDVSPPGIARNADALVLGGIVLIGIGSEWRERFHPAVGVLLPMVGAIMVIGGWAILRRAISRLTRQIDGLNAKATLLAPDSKESG